MQTSIEQLLIKTTGFTKGLTILETCKPDSKILSKAAEEASELVTVLLQKINKPESITDEDLLQEIVDVQMHLCLLQRRYKSVQKASMVLKKVNKFLKSKDFIKYKKAYDRHV